MKELETPNAVRRTTSHPNIEGFRAAGAALAGALFAVCVAAPIAAAQGRATPPGEERLDGVAAVVQGEPIFESEVEEQLYLFLLQAQARSRPDSATEAELRKEILDRLVDEKLIVQEAERLDVRVRDEEIEGQIDRAISDAKERLGGEAAYRAELAREGIAETDLRERYRQEIRRQMLANQLLRRQLDLQIEVSPAEAVQFYEAQPEDFPKKPRELRLAVIQIPVEPEAEEKQKAREQAEEALRRVRGGESFARVAQELSQDPNTRNAGGDLGFFARGQLDTTFERVAFSLQPGEISNVVETPFGFHVIKVEERDDAQDEVHARHILIRVPLKPSDEQRALEMAKSVHEEATSGTDYGELVRRHSRYRGPVMEGGDLGYVSVTEFSPEVRQAVETLSVGEIAGPIPTPQGFVIFKMLDERPERRFRVEEIRERLPDLVREIKLREQYETWVASLRDKAQVEFK